jgi:hypothetical protein
MREGRFVIDRNSDPRLGLSEATAYWTGFVGEHYLRLPYFGQLRKRVEEELLRRNPPEMGTVQIPRIDPRETAPGQIRRDYVKGYVPFVLKGVAAGWPAIRKWTPEFFASNYGADKICVRVKSAGVGAESVYTRDVTVTELVDNIRNDGEYYANNLEDLFNNHPELRKDLLLREVEAYSCADPPKFAPGEKRGWRLPRWGEILSTQIFISNANGRTGYHCAAGGNFFLQVHGRKKWVFVNPRHSPFMYPVIRKDFFYSCSAVDFRMGRDEQMKEGFGLYNLIPKYEVVLEPGDVLYSPQWWWHTIDNLGLSIGVAMRFRTGAFAGNPVYSAMTGLSPNLLKHLSRVFRTGWGSDTTAARTIFEPEGSKVKVPLPPSKSVPLKSEAAAGRRSS